MPNSLRPPGEPKRLVGAGAARKGGGDACVARVPLHPIPSVNPYRPSHCGPLWSPASLSTQFPRSIPIALPRSRPLNSPPILGRILHTTTTPTFTKYML